MAHPVVALLKRLLAAARHVSEEHGDFSEDDRARRLRLEEYEDEEIEEEEDEEL